MGRVRLGFMMAMVIVMMYLFELAKSQEIKVLVEPTYMEIDVTNKVSREFTIKNISSENVSYSVSMDKPPMTDEYYYIGDMVRISPDVIHLSPGEEGKVVVAVNRVVDSRNINYLGKIRLEEISADSHSPAGQKESIGLYIIGNTSEIRPAIGVTDIRYEEEVIRGRRKGYLTFILNNYGECLLIGKAKTIKTDVVEGKGMVERNLGLLTQFEEREIVLSLTDEAIEDEIKLQIIDSRFPENVLYSKTIDITNIK